MEEFWRGTADLMTEHKQELPRETHYRVFNDYVQTNEMKCIKLVPHVEYHRIVFAVKQRNTDILPELLEKVSYPNYEREFYSSDEIRDLTSNPIATEQGNQIRLIFPNYLICSNLTNII